MEVSGLFTALGLFFSVEYARRRASRTTWRAAGIWFGAAGIGYCFFFVYCSSSILPLR
jgi:hypothetical protein